MSTRLRFAPSPTGHLHIGGARTALFNWLYARKTGGVFVLRVEDTDLERSSEEMAEGILEGLRWLGLDWDEGPIFQSRRLDGHRTLADSLLQAGKAYRCFCGTADDAERQCGCRGLDEEESQRRAAGGESFAVRFRVPEGEVRFDDRVFGEVRVDARQIEDFVLLRSDGTPTYHLSVVADDLDLEITHVVRGADHLSNTSKQVLLYRALERPGPVFAHLPLILGPDRKRLSKRHGATSVLEYREQGFVPAALRNYLALLGWSPGDDRELLDDAELVESFQLERINKADAVFDLRKLEWLNGQKLSRMPADELEPEVRRVLEDAGLWKSAWGGAERPWFVDTLDLLKKGARRLTDFSGQYRAFFDDEFEYDQRGRKKYLEFDDPAAEQATLEGLAELEQGLRELEPYDLETTEALLRGIGERHGLHTGKFIGAVRVALTGQPVAPGIFEVMIALGRERTVRRLARVRQLARS